MKNALIVFSVLVFVFFAVLGMSQETIKQEEVKDEAIPEGMEKVRIGQSELLLPKGAKVLKKGGLVVLEGSEEYVARQIANFNERVEKIETELEELRKEVSALKQILGKGKDTLIFEQKNQ